MGCCCPAQLTLVYVAAQWGEPRSRRVKRLASRLGGASLPMCALHVPLYAVFSRVERCCRVIRGCV